MTIQPPENDYPALDYETIRARLQQRAQTAFPEWTDHSSAGFGNVLLDLFAYVGDVLGYYIESQGREARLATVSQRENAVALARMLGYTPMGTTAARAQVVFSLMQPHGADILIRAGTRMRTQDVTPAVHFRLVEDVRIARGAVDAHGTVEHATTHLDVVDTTGARDMSVPLVHAPYLDKSIAIVDANGRRFTEVETFLDSTAQDAHFMVQVDQADRARVMFGNGIMGAAPSGMLDITYKTGGGLAGNVEANRIVVLENPVQDTSGCPVRVTISNPQAASGGRERESIASIRQRAPQSLRVSNRTITREDFETNALKVPGVARALMLTSNEDARIPENTGRLFVVPEGGGALTEELSRAVLHQVTHRYPCTLTFQVVPESANYVAIDVEADVEFIQGAPWGEAPADRVREEAKRKLRRLFSLDAADGTPNPRAHFGYYLGSGTQSHGEVAWSEVVTALCATQGLRKVTRLRLNEAQQDIRLQPFEFPVLGNVTLNVHGGP